MNHHKPLILVVLDGWGYKKSADNNAIALAKTPHWDHWWQTMPHMLLNASGESVGLPSGQMGNSEVGHMHIGAGRVVSQDLTRINRTIAQNQLPNLPSIQALISSLSAQQRNLHIAGLLSDGGVHSHESHWHALLNAIAPNCSTPIYLHCFLDGRDTPPQSALTHLQKLESIIAPYKNVRIASLCGRYYAMDRDKRWERTKLAYDLLTLGHAVETFDDASTAISHYYQNSKSDEFIPPTLIGDPVAMVDGDGCLITNFRADRMRQLTQSLLVPEFSEFHRTVWPKLNPFLTMTRYSDAFFNDALFPKFQLKNTLGEVLSKEGLTQLRIAETEKYAHVTFFFNGGIETAFANEDRILINSPKVRTYDLQPEMSAPELTNALKDAIESSAYDVIICNYANADMVGHSGNMQATIAAIQCLDHCLSIVHAAAMRVGGNVLITADHGNAEQMHNPATNQAHTAHTSQPVPLLFLGEGWDFTQQEGSLIDIAPTLLTLMGILPPEEMNGTIVMEPK